MNKRKLLMLGLTVMSFAASSDSYAMFPNTYTGGTDVAVPDVAPTPPTPVPVPYSNISPNTFSTSPSSNTKCIIPVDGALCEYLGW